MKIDFMPKTKLGKWSVGLIIAMFLLFFVGRLFYLKIYTSVSAGETILSDIVTRPGVALTMLFGFVSGIIAFIVGLAAIIKNKERSILAFIATIIGALLILFIVGNLIAPDSLNNP